MSRNTRWNSHQTTPKKPARILRPVRGAPVTMDEIGGVEKFKSDRRTARREWRKEDERYSK